MTPVDVMKLFSPLRGENKLEYLSLANLSCLKKLTRRALAYFEAVVNKKAQQH
jgi:hypothetical protein